jgi:hypothetical protein
LGKACVLTLGPSPVPRFLMADTDRDARVVLPEFQAWVSKNARYMMVLAYA